MNAEIIVAAHPYYSVTDENGAFELRDVPAGELFSEPRTWQKKATVSSDETTVVNFVLSEK
jgi:hypothetical protein